MTALKHAGLKHSLQAIPALLERGRGPAFSKLWLRGGVCTAAQDMRLDLELTFQEST